MSNTIFGVRVEVSRIPESWMVVRYIQRPGMQYPGFKVEDILHMTKPYPGDRTVFTTDLRHLIPDIMGTGIFSPVRVQIEHEIEMVRRAREAEIAVLVVLPSNPATWKWCARCGTKVALDIFCVDCGSTGEV